MQISYQPIDQYPFYSIDQCNYLQLLSRSKYSIYLYQHKQSMQCLVVKQIPYSQQILKVYDALAKWEHLQSMVRIRGMSIMITRRRSSYKRQKSKSDNIKVEPSSITQIQFKDDPLPSIPQDSQITVNENLYTREEKTLLIWMQKYSCNLSQLFKAKRLNFKPFSKSEAGKFLLQMITFLQILQKDGISHRDIKPENILVDTKRYRLCDFDETILQNVHRYKQQITLTTIAYSSPSFLLHYQKFGSFNKGKLFCPYKLDVYALGLTFLTFCSLGKFQAQQRLQYLQNKQLHEQYIRQQRRMYIKQNAQFQQFNTIAKIMLEQDEYKRDDFKTLLIKVKNGLGGLILYQNQIEILQFRKGQQSMRRLGTAYHQQDISDASSGIHEKKFQRRKNNRKGWLGATTYLQGSFLVCLIVIYFLSLIFLSFSHESFPSDG